MSTLMGDFSPIRITDEGKDLIAKNRQGQTLIFTRVALGDGTVSGNNEIDGLTALKSEKHSVNITKIENTRPGQVRIQFNINNSEITTPFKFREIGVMAKLENGAEKLYCYSNAGENANMIYDKNAPIQERIVYLDFVVATSDNVKIVLNLSNIYATMDNLKEELNTHNDDENAHPKLFNKITAAQDAKLKEHREKGELDHPEKSVKEKHLADNSVGHMQLQVNSVYGSAVKDGSITPEKLSKEYLPITGGTVKGYLHATQSLSTNGSIFVDISKIDGGDDTSVINVGWLKANSVNSIDGKKGDVDLLEALYKINNETPMTGKTMEEYFQNKGIVKNYYNPESCKTENLPFPGCAKLSFPFYKADHSYVELAYGQQGTAWRVWTKGRKHEDTPWTISLDSNNLNDVISLKDFDLRNKTGIQLSQYGFCKFHVGDNGTSLGYPESWVIVFNIPHGLKNGGDTKQIAIGAWGTLWYRSVNGRNTTDNTPWVKAASTDYVDKAIKNATKVEILDFE